MKCQVISTEAKRRRVCSFSTMAENSSTYTDTTTIRAVNHRSTEFGRQELRSNEYEQQYPSKNIQKIKSSEGPRKKSSSFQITRVVAKSGVLDHTNEDGDSLDDLDETNTEDLSSDFQDISKNTDLCDQSIDEPVVVQYTKPPDELGDTSFKNEPSTTQMKCANVNNSISGFVPAAQLMQGEQVKDKTVDIQSRFKVVKIESKDPFKRGRWKCLDFLDPLASDKPAEKQDKPVDELSGSGNSSTSSSVHYVSDIDDPAKLLLATNLGYADSHQIVEPLPIHPGMAGCDIGSSEHPVQSNTNLIQTLPNGATSRVAMTGGVMPNGVSAATAMDISSGQTSQALPAQVPVTSLVDRQNSIPMAVNISGQTIDIGMVDSQLYQQQQTNIASVIAPHGQSAINQLSTSLSQTQLAQQSNATTLHDAGSVVTSSCAAGSEPSNVGDMSDFVTQPQPIVTQTNLGASTPVTTTTTEVSHADYSMAPDPTSYPAVLEDATSSMPASSASFMLTSDKLKFSSTEAILRPPLLEMVSASMHPFAAHAKEDER